MDVVLWDFSRGIIKFVRYQTVLSGLTYLSRRCDLFITARA